MRTAKILFLPALTVNVVHMKQAHVFISGFVQGVGFRQFIAYQAGRLGIFGWIRNNPNGAVEALFQGSKENIEEMIKLCKKGPLISEVEDVVVEWEDSQQRFTEFETRS